LYHVFVLTHLSLDALIADTESEILRLIERAEDDRTGALYDMVRYHLGLDPSAPARGKRLRPLLGLLAYESIAGDHRKALPGAAAVELGHNFSLVHDDIEDQDTERRYRAALWTVVGVPQAINTGDTLFVLSRLALHRLTDLGFPDAKVLALTRVYDETCLALCEGQFLDIWTSEHGDEPMSVELYFDMIGRKTAALIAASIKSGAMLATDDEHVIDAYHRFGWALGIAFQLNDDLLGIWGEEQSTGKEPSDLAKHKKTLPVIYALEHATPGDRERLLGVVRGAALTPDDLAAARAIMERTGAHDYTRGQARRYRDEAIAALDLAGVVDGSAAERLREIIVSAISA
jgi:geranylgeranyl diphosphate synthase type I